MSETGRRLHLVAAEAACPANPQQTCLKCGCLLLGREPRRTVYQECWTDSPLNCERVGPPAAKTIPLSRGNAA